MRIRWPLVAVAAATLVAAGCAGQPAPVAEPATASADAPVVLFLGDSYTEGTGLATEDLQSRWSTVLADRRGWQEVNAGCNGSGYTRPGATCGNTYAERLPSLDASDPDIVIVSGGVNDLGATPETIDSQVSQTFTELRDTFPGAQLYAVNGIYYTGNETPPLLDYLNESVSSAVTRVEGTYLNIGDPLLGHPELMARDGLHPNPAGHLLIADLTQSALQQTDEFTLSQQAG
ncbi:SGNH/GDSL hydrolase family protein [Demequina aurantiaca]|uniref:SGNH/GDSL hydrolase family protein n=1 Tax=Demequina aurantiaca TaxID=676200 RepID=UPI003D3264E5